MATKLRQISVEGHKFYFGFSFDIDDFIGDGVWWLQIYNSNKEIIYEKPFASGMGKLDIKKVRQIIKQEFLTHKGAIL